MWDLNNVAAAVDSWGEGAPVRHGPPSGGGVLAVEAFAAGEIVLTSWRFACEGCVRRTRAALDAERAVTAVEVTAPGRLLVR